MASSCNQVARVGYGLEQRSSERVSASKLKEEKLDSERAIPHG